MKASAILRAEQGERLIKAREAKGFKTAAEALEAHPEWGKESTYRAHENGQNSLTGAAVAYGEAYDVDPGWLITGIGRGPTKKTPAVPDAISAPAEVPATEATLRIREMPRDFPIKGSAEGGDDGEFEFNLGETIDYVRRPPRLFGVADSYGLYMVGSSMSPWREARQTVYVHPKLQTDIGDYVVVQLHPKREGEPPRAYVKRLKARTPTQIILTQFNPPKDIYIPKPRVITMHKILDWSELLGI